MFNILFIIIFFTRFFTLYELYFSTISSLSLIAISLILFKNTKIRMFNYITLLSTIEVLLNIYFRYIQKEHLIIYIIRILILIVLFISINTFIKNKISLLTTIIFYLMFITAIFHTIVNALIVYSLNLPTYISQYLIGNTSKFLMFLGLIITIQSYIISVNIKMNFDTHKK